ncbi:right-handed parallel beta-helix repeat-containing protein [Citreicella sp. C3M06]|uniref:LamG domain-containing protein n=1 Tax=Citreicella sp. C3M06 TaxID=2841564 RepID=UPI001C09FAD4|nr:LamG domain-containing protein [Citreicella sp. C3M06]MBU2960034.1 right-handed parallel beta-helix repeat-containing protein [Citreicella sp. C3M06]
MTSTTEAAEASSGTNGDQSYYLSDFVDISSQSIEDVRFEDDVRIVTSQAEFDAAYTALAAGAGGVILLDTAGGPYTLSHYDVQNAQIDAPVMITSLTPEDPAVVSSVYMRNHENFHLSDVKIEGDSGTLITVKDTDNSGIYESEISSIAEGAAGLNEEAGGYTIGATGADIVEVENFSFIGNELHNLFHGATFREVVGLTYTDNELYALQGDGVRLGGVQDALIADNWFHDFLGSTYEYNHSDFIQLWGANIWLNNEDITIQSNFFDNSTGAAYQVIFGQNEDYEENGYLFENIVVDNNVIWGSAYHGISVSDTSNMVVTNNTLIYIEDAYYLNADGTQTTLKSPGWIDIDGTNPVVEKNVGLRILDDGDNMTLSHGTDSELDQLNQYTNLTVGESGDLRDITLLPDSALNGVYGSSLLWFDETPDTLLAVARASVSVSDLSVYTLDAGLSRGPDGLIDENTIVTWTLDDGRSFTGSQIEVDFETPGLHSYTLTVTQPDGSSDTITRTVEIEDPLLVDLELVDGVLTNVAPDGVTLTNLSSATLDGDSLRIGEGAMVEIARTVGDIFNLSSFDFSMTLDIDEGSSGTLFMIYQSLEATVQTDGSISFKFSNGDTWFSVRSASGLLNDGPVDLSFVYDGAMLSLYADGELVAETAASGSTQSAQYWGLTFGNPWKASVDASLSNISIKSEASSAEEISAAATAEDNTASVVVIETLFETDFSSADIAGMTISEEDIVTMPSGETGVMVAGGDVEVNRDTGYLYDTGSFEITFTAQHFDTTTEGTILYLHETLSLSVRSDGRLLFSLTTDEGTQLLRTPEMPLADGAAHEISIGYDSEAGVMQIAVDGEVVAQAEQTGLTAVAQSWGLTIGHPWAGDEPDMGITSLEISDGTIISDPTPTGYDADALIFLDFNDTVTNEVASAAMPEVSTGTLTYASDADDTWAEFDGSTTVSVSRYVEELHSRDTFEFVVSIRDDDNSDWEAVFEIYDSMALSINDDDFYFTMELGDETVSLQSNSDVLADGDFHEVKLGYDSSLGSLAMMVDGVVVDETYATGLTTEEQYWGLTIGSGVGDGLDADITHFSMNESADWLAVA